MTPTVDASVAAPAFTVIISDSDLPESMNRPSKAFFHPGGCVAVGSFGKGEIEVTAGQLVTFLRDGKGDSWSGFKLSELVAFYTKQGWVIDGAFFGLIGLWFDDASSKIFSGNPWTESAPFLAFTPDGTICVTDLFVKACCRNNPGL